MSRNEHDAIARAAGINTVYPGTSEYRQNYVEAALVNNSLERVNKNVLRDHNIRARKYENPAKYIGITGNSEAKTRFNITDEKFYKKTKVSRKDYDNINFDRSPFVGKSEYADKFQQSGEHDSKGLKLPINPKLDFNYASQGRPYADHVELDKSLHSTSQYGHFHQWPITENRRRFEWMK